MDWRYPANAASGQDALRRHQGGGPGYNLPPDAVGEASLNSRSEGLVLRAVVPETPVRVEYELTRKGRELQDALREIGSWAERWIPLDHDSGVADPATPPRRDRKIKHA